MPTSILAPLETTFAVKVYVLPPSTLIFCDNPSVSEPEASTACPFSIIVLPDNFQFLSPSSNSPFNTK